MFIKILVIEDEFPVLDTITDILVSAGHDVTSASNGEDGLKKALNDPPDLILCDINMPGINGYQVLETLKAALPTQNIPFIFLSAKIDAKDMRKGMMLGANDYLTKPFKTDELLGSVNTQIERHKKITGYYHEEIQKTKYYEEITGLGKRNLLEKCLKDLASDEKTSISLLIIAVNKYETLKYILNEAELKSLNLELVKRIKDSLEQAHQIYVLNSGKFACTILNNTRQLILLTVGDIINNIKKPLNLSNHSLHLSSSIGVAFTNENNNTFTNLISNAELALNRALESGKNNFQIFKAALKKKYTDILKLQNALHNALKNNELMLHYQPKVDLNKNTITGFETLLRWRSPQYGNVPPSKFIPLAESNDLIIDLGDWVINKTIAQLQDWERAGLKIKPIAVNMSVKQFVNFDLCKTIVAQLNSVAINNDLIEFELTESIFVDKIEQTKKTLKLFKTSGIKLSLDDFGTGYSSLAYIKNFPFDKIKIDKTFINDIPEDKNASSLTTTIISMAKNMDFVVIAEGVETELQANFLRKNNCDEMQGFLYSKPLPAANIKKMLS